jgi:RimJ/RimL family protein N-acetyltransferase
LTLDDAAAYQAVRLRALTTDPLAFRSTLEEESRLSRDEYAARLANAENRTIGAFMGDELVGIGTILRETRTTVRHRGGIVGMYVTAGARGSGAAGGIMERLIEYARSVGLRMVCLSVEGENVRARRLYERWGFTEYGRLPRAELHGDQFTDEVLMMLSL